MIQPAGPVSGETRSALAMKISIVAPSFNPERCFEARLPSMQPHRVKFLEWLPMDGRTRLTGWARPGSRIDRGGGRTAVMGRSNAIGSCDR